MTTAEKVHEDFKKIEERNEFIPQKYKILFLVTAVILMLVLQYISEGYLR